MVHLPPLEQLRLQREVEHVYQLGLRATAEAFAEVARRIGGMPTVHAVLTEYQPIRRQHLAATGGDHFPRHQLHAVPR